MAEQDEAAVLAVIEERLAAIRAGDAARAVATLAEDVEAFELVPPLALRGPEARDQAGTQTWLDSWEGAVEIELRDLKIVAAAELAFAHSLQRLSGTRRGGGAVSLWLRSTLAFRKRAGEWKIVHAHSSVPFHADGSFRAAVDLAPP